MELTPLQEAVLNYAKQHESDLREKAIEAVTLFLANASFDDLKGKFIAGCEEHGPIDPLQDWNKELKNEATDAFWYSAIISFLLHAKN